MKVIEPFLERILGQLARIFEFSMSKSNYILLEAALESISSIASMKPVCFDGVSRYTPLTHPCDPAGDALAGVHFEGLVQGK